jgi:threonyl-tRNA synthetase
VFITEAQMAEESSRSTISYSDLGISASPTSPSFSDRPHSIGDDIVWDKAEAALMAALKSSGCPWTLNRGEGRFTVPSWNTLRDAIGRTGSKARRRSTSTSVAQVPYTTSTPTRSYR